MTYIADVDPILHRLNILPTLRMRRQEKYWKWNLLRMYCNLYTFSGNKCLYYLTQSL